VAINTWWNDDSSERYWVEITDRPDLGEDLHTPTRTTAGGSTPGYELINFIKPGDVVFHWQNGREGGKALVGWSIASGEVEDSTIEWQAHGTSGRAAAPPPPRPAWLMPLVDYTPLERPITYDDVLRLEPEIRAVEAALRGRVSGPLYFPFALSDKRPIRTAQNYLAKWPRSLAESLGVAGVGAELSPVPDDPQKPNPIKTRRRGQGYISDSRVRRAIERRAVDVAIKWYELRDYQVEYTGDNKPYDLVVSRADEIRRVEVKGTTTEGETVELTYGEVDNAEDFTPVDLFLVYGITFERLPDGNAVGFGGIARRWDDWTPDRASLKAIRFRHTVPLHGFEEFGT